MSRKPPLDPHAPVGDVAIDQGSIWLIRALSGIAAVAAFLLLFLARELFIPIALAVLLALVLLPITRLIVRVVRFRALAAAIVVIGGLGVLGSTVYAIHDPVSDSMSEVPRKFWILDYKFRAIKQPIEEIRAAMEKAEELAKIGSGGDKRQVVVERPGLLSQILGGIQFAAIQMLLVVILLYYLLAAGHLILQQMITLVRDDRRDGQRSRRHRSNF